MAVAAAVSVSESRVRGRDRRSEHAVRPRHNDLRCVHTDRLEESVEPQRHGEHGEAVSPFVLPAVSRMDGPVSTLLNEDENWRGLRSPRARAAGAGLRGERSGSTRSPDPAVSGRPTAGDLASPLNSRGPVLRRCAGGGVVGLCASAFFRVGGWPLWFSSCLRAFVFATWAGGSVPPLCPPCLCGLGGWVEIRNSKFEIRNRPLLISRAPG